MMKTTPEANPLPTNAPLDKDGKFNVMWPGAAGDYIMVNKNYEYPEAIYIQSLTFQVNMVAMQNMHPDEIVRKLKMSNITFNAAKAIVSMIPIVAIYPFLQRYFVTGIVMGAVKE